MRQARTAILHRASNTRAMRQPPYRWAPTLRSRCEVAVDAMVAPWLSAYGVAQTTRGVPETRVTERSTGLAAGFLPTTISVHVKLSETMRRIRCS